MSEYKCPNDGRSLKNNEKVCEQCSRATRVRLAEIPVLYIEAGAYLVPGKGGHGSSSSERTIGVNLSALGFRHAGEMLGVLNAWEDLVRDECELSPRVEKGSIQERVESVCLFLLAHSQWLTKYDAAPDWVQEVAKIHTQGEAATRRFREKITTIKCPTSLEEFAEGGEEIIYKSCDQRLTLLDSPIGIIECKRCGTEWTTLRLVAVAVSSPGNVIWFDSGAIAAFLGITPDYVTKIAKRFNAKRRGRRGEEVYDLAEIRDLRDQVRLG